MQLGHLAVIPVEEGEEVLRQVALVFPVEGADYAAVDADPEWIVGVLIGDEDVAGMHVGVEEAVAEHLGEEHLHPALGQQLHVGTVGLQRRDVGDRNAVDALHHQHLLAAVIRVDLGHIERLRAGEVAPQLDGVGGFAHQVQLVEYGLAVLLHHLDGAQPRALGHETGHQTSQRLHQPQIGLDDGLYVGTDHLDDDLPAILLQAGGMDLGNGGGRQRRLVEVIEQGLDGAAQARLYLAPGLLATEGGNPVLQQGQLFGDVRRQQIPPGRQHLAKLDEDGTERLEGEANAGATAQIRLLVLQPEQAATQQASWPGLITGRHQLVDALLQQNADDAIETLELLRGHQLTRCSRRASRNSTAFRCWASSSTSSLKLATSSGPGASLASSVRYSASWRWERHSSRPSTRRA
ncbi:hypothetical protein D3C85_877250 [compost metagenome]